MELSWVLHTVHMMIVLLHWPMHVEVPSVHIMTMNLEIVAVSVIALIQKLWILRLVLFTNLCGRSISKHIVVIILWESEEYFNDIMISNLGKIKKITLINLMMKKT